MPAIPPNIDAALAELDAQMKTGRWEGTPASTPHAGGPLHTVMLRLAAMAKWPFRRARSITCRLCERDISSDAFEQHSTKCSAIQSALSAKQRADLFLGTLCSLLHGNDGELHKLCQEALLVEDSNHQGVACLAHTQCKLQQNGSSSDQLNVQRALYLVRLKQTALDQLHRIGYKARTTGAKEGKNLTDLLSAAIRTTLKRDHNHPLAVAAPSISDFAVLKYLSKGAFGSVYLARHKRTGDLFALKAIDKNETQRKNTIAHALTERRALALVNSPWIVSLYYAFEAECTLFLVMEFMVGGNLGSLLNVTKVLNRAAVQFYAAELIAAVDTLHSAGIVHHDLKPENVVVDAEGHIRLIDLGLAQTEGVDRAENLGTPDYMAPELVLGDGHHSSAVDVWSIGCILFEMLNGRPPFHAGSAEAIFERIVGGYQCRKADPDELDCLIRKLLASDPRQRPTCGQLKDDPFFAGIHWADLRGTLQPPFVPNPKSADDTVYFEPCNRTAMSIVDGLDEARLVRLNEGVSSQSKGSSANALSEASSQLTSSLPGSSTGSSPFTFKNIILLESLNRKQLKERSSGHHSPSRRC